jgi:hypothetical protein
VIITLFNEKRKGLKASVMLLSIVVIDAVSALLSVSYLGGSQGWRVSDSLNLYSEVVRNPSSILFFWDALTRLTQIWAPFFSPLYITISILGVMYLQATALTSWHRRLILAWLCASSIGSILVAPIFFNPASPTQSESQLWRLLFLTPFQLTTPFGLVLITELPRRLITGSKNMPCLSLEDNYRSIIGFLVAAIFVVAVLLSWMPIEGRLILLLAVLPAITGIAVARAGKREIEILSNILLVSFLLVGFNYATRCLTQLLIDPHNYRPS